MLCWCWVWKWRGNYSNGMPSLCFVNMTQDCKLLHLSQIMFTVLQLICSIFFITFTGSVTPCPFCGTESGGSLVGKCDHTSRFNRTHAGTQQTTFSRLSLADRAWETDDDESLMLGTQITNKTQAHTSTHKRAHTPDACTHTFVSSLLLICSFPFAAWCFSLCHQWFCGDGDRWRDLERIREIAEEEKSPSALYVGLT